jgi:hypothetical protein
MRTVRRYPVLSFLAFLVLSALVYRAVAHRVTAFVNNQLFWHFESRMVEDRSRLRPAPGVRWLGMYRPELPWDYARYYTVAESLQTTPTIVSWYQAWGETEDAEFKTEAVEHVLAKGLVPMITWEPWTGTFKGHEKDTSGGLADLVGGAFDPYIRRWARAVARVHKPVFLRPLHEMGNPWYSWTMPHGNSPAMIAESWRHIVRIFREEGARNAAFVWTPHIAADTLAWPGNEWVDWVGLDLFNYGTMAEKGKWQDFSSLAIPMLAEVGSTAYGGDRRDWWVDAFRQLPHFPQVRAVVIFDNPACTNTTGVPVDWGFTQTPGIIPALAPLSGPAGFPSRP